MISTNLKMHKERYSKKQGILPLAKIEEHIAKELLNRNSSKIIKSSFKDNNTKTVEMLILEAQNSK